MHPAGIVGLVALLGMAACENKVEVPDLGGDPDRQGPNCDVDDNDSISTAMEIIMGGGENRDTLCPRFDWDYWSFNVSGERQLLDVSASYNKSGDIALALDLEGPKDLCVSATACSSNNQCPGQQCDTVRGFCRKSITVDCVEAAHCAAAETCTRADIDMVKDRIFETASSATLHRIDTTLPAFIAGNYFLRVYDQHNTAEDENAEYVLKVSQRQDPDIHEPNNAANMATVLGTADSTTGYFSYLDDVDYYRIDPAFSGPAIIHIDLSWLDGSQTQPTWTILQDGQEVVPTHLPRTITGGRVLGGAFVLFNNEPIYVVVENADGAGIDADSPYTLDVTVFNDTEEGDLRDDSPTTPTVLSVPSTGSSDSALERRLIAENDKDWYRVERSNGGNSLLDFTLVANSSPPANAPFLLKVQVYYPTGGTCTGCASSSTLGRPHECIADTNECAMWFQRPAVKLPVGSPDEWAAEFGGPTPNNLVAQIPFYTDYVYILVQHNTNTPLPYEGFSDEVDYTLTVQNRLEEDVEDQENPDNVFVPSPLEDNLGKSHFWDHARELNADDFVPDVVGSSPTTEFALLTSAPVVEAGACTALTVRAYTANGDPSGSGSASFVSADGAFFTEATCTTPGASASTAPTGTIYFQAAAAGLAIVTVSQNGDEGVPIAVLVYAAGGTAPGAITIAGPTSGIMGTKSTALTADIPGNSTVALNIASVATGTGTTSVMCHAEAVSETEEECPYIDNQTGTVTMTTPCVQTGTTPTCQIPIVGGNSYDFHLVPASTSLVVIRISHPTNAWAPATWAYAAHEPAKYTFNNASNSGSGRISYLGDNDFFYLNTPTTLLPGHMTATLHYNGNTDLRVGIARVADAASWCSGGCGISVTGSSCNPCEEPGTRCNYVTATGSLFTAWVNDEDFDDWDNSASANYNFSFTYQEGCPAACSQYVCGQ